MKRKSRDPRNIHIRMFACEVCGCIAPATKWRCKTEPGHIKHMWCIWCQDTTQHTQLGGYTPPGEPMRVVLKLETIGSDDTHRALIWLEQVEKLHPQLRIEAEIEQHPPNPPEEE